MHIDTAQHRTIAPSAQAGLLARAVGQVRQFLCGLHGHDALLHFEETRMSLQCTSCGYQTPGWDLTSTQPAARTSQAPPRVMRLPLVGARRVA